MTRKQKKVLIRIVISAVFVAALMLIKVEMPWYVQFGLYLIPYFVIGYDILKKAFKGILHRQVFDENFLMAIATVGALAIAVYNSMHGLEGEFAEGVFVMLFYQVGELFQSYAVGKSRKNISELMDIRPDYVNVIKDGNIVRVEPGEVAIGSEIVVRPGEKIPIDGTVTEGSSTLDTRALTGESVPTEISVGTSVISGCINMSGVIHIVTTREFGESTVSKILDLVENAGSKKSKSENFISKFAKYYTPIVCISALLLAIIPPVINIILNNSAGWGDWIYRALTFLVISCPCALVISIPLSFFAGIGGAGRKGILIKGSNYLETLAHTGVIVFDKTGTLTKGVFEVSGIHHNELENERLIEYAALAESYSNHPISLSLKRAYGRDVDMSRVSDVQEISGHGVVASVDGRKVYVGNDKLMKQYGIEYADCHKTGTIIHIAIDGQYAGHIVISDVVKPTSQRAIEKLRRAGVFRVVMLTGDSGRVADAVAAELGIDEVHSSLLPADKVREVERLLDECNGKRSRLAFVGDGINDAPVLSRADIGIAMGALGSDAAIEAADVVLMDDDPVKIATAIQIARKCMRIVYENIYFAIGIKLICLVLGALAIANMWAAIFADVGVMVIAVLNAIRVMMVKKL